MVLEQGWKNFSGGHIAKGIKELILRRVTVMDLKLKR
jgi:hypothetical protein